MRRSALRRTRLRKLLAGWVPHSGCTVIEKRIVPPIGKAFDFTREELDQLKKVAPDAIRLPVNEDLSAEESTPAPVVAPPVGGGGRGAKASRMSTKDGDRAVDNGEL